MSRTKCTARAGARSAAVRWWHGPVFPCVQAAGTLSAPETASFCATQTRPAARGAGFEGSRTAALAGMTTHALARGARFMRLFTCLSPS